MSQMLALLILQFSVLHFFKKREEPNNNNNKIKKEKGLSRGWAGNYGPQHTGFQGCHVR
jgi:hypothetical protein